MLILRRKKNESILIGDSIRITVLESAADGVRLAIDAPKSISILREELTEAEKENKESVAPDYVAVSSLQSSLFAHLQGNVIKKAEDADDSEKTDRSEKADSAKNSDSPNSTASADGITQNEPE